jgi:HD-GYP domain-containing protein (c-di-GMP phosphodiesterase class II)
MDIDTQDLLNRLHALNNIGVALTSETDGTRLLERILQAARGLTFADGGTLYTKTDDDHLKFEIMLSDSLNIHQGGTSGLPVNMPLLPLHTETGEQNLKLVAAAAAVTKQTINIPDVYQNTLFEFSGTWAFDQRMNYRSKSFLTVPMKNHDNEVIGVLQLINARDIHSQAIKAFSFQEQQLVESLASQAAVALLNQRLIAEQKHLFKSFIQLIAKAIDDKSPYTGTHCERVPIITMMLAEAVSKCKHNANAEIAAFKLNEDLEYEIWVASMLHDCGKILTPEYVIDKATKLETIYDRVHQIDTRYAALQRELKIKQLEQQVAALKAGQPFDETAMQQCLQKEYQQLEQDRQFIHHSNIGTEFMSDADKERIRAIGQRTWHNHLAQERPLLLPDEIYNLTITRGTLTAEERNIINHHIVATINMLNELPYPKNLRNVPEYAGGHHERMDGKGYPNGLTRQQMSLPARIMGIADIFEALTATNRPYKKPMPLSMALTILGKMKLDNHIDPDLFDVFVHEKIYEKYAKKYLSSEQIDDVDITRVPGYNPDYRKSS